MRTPVLLAAFLLGALLAGCTTPAPVAPPPSSTILVVDEAGAPVRGAFVGVSAGNATLAAFETGADGRFPRAAVPPGATVAVRFGGLAALAAADTLGDRLELQPATEAALPGTLGFLAPVDLVCQPTPFQARGCGDFGEPQLEVAGDGTVWASAVCCIGQSPPIWTSRDGGKTFQTLEAGTSQGIARDAFGIEGDFAIDDAGDVYFFDIAVGSTWFSRYSATGELEFQGAWPVEPIVDRPWVRAGAPGQVWIAYNTGSATRVYGSTDGGETWDATARGSFPCGLGNLGQGPQRDDLAVVASCGDTIRLWRSLDGGTTWSDDEPLPLPDTERPGGWDIQIPPVVDEAGNLYVAFVHSLDPKTTDLFLARQRPDGSWLPTVALGAPGDNTLPWPAAGRAGHVGILWYHADADVEPAQRTWSLMAAASIDADQETPSFQSGVADPNLLRGPIGRNLGDFLQSDIAPDGRLMGVYAKRDAAGLTNRFIATDGGLDLGPTVYPNGPKA
ncbi:MAG: repeat-like domain [Thermoplasmata archaeon]|nr:repeat-like domain [Thermoplasmata archaeon]